MGSGFSAAASDEATRLNCVLDYLDPGGLASQAWMLLFFFNVRGGHGQLSFLDEG